jgi:hypothetical protein
MTMRVQRDDGYDGGIVKYINRKSHEGLLFNLSVRREVACYSVMLVR